MSDRIAWFISGACVTALLFTTTGFKTVPEGPGGLGTAASMVTVMEDLNPDEDRLLYTVPNGHGLSLTDWTYAPTESRIHLVFPDSTVKDLHYWWNPPKIMRTGVAVPAGTEIWAVNLVSKRTYSALTGQLYRE